MIEKREGKLEENTVRDDWFHLESLLVQLQSHMLLGDYIQAIEKATTIIQSLELMDDDLNTLEYNHPDRHLAMEAYHSRGLAYQQIGDSYRAISDLENSIKLYGNSETRNTLAMLYFQQMNLTMAYEHIQTVIATDIDNPSYLLNAGVIFMACDEMQQALNCFSRVLTSQIIQPLDYVDALIFRASVYLEINDITKAICDITAAESHSAYAEITPEMMAVADEIVTTINAVA